MVIKTLAVAWQGSELLDCFKDDAYRALLDSSLYHEIHGRYSLFCSNPHTIIKTCGQSCSMYKNGKWTTFEQDSPLAFIESELSKFVVHNTTGLPFIGGAVGYFSYEFGQQLEGLLQIAKGDHETPDSHFCLYDGAIVVDRYQNQTHIVAAGLVEDPDAFVQRRMERLKSYQPRAVTLESTTPYPAIIMSNMSAADYIQKTDILKKYIESGDVYQMNLAQRFEICFTGKADALYRRLSTINPAPYAALIEYTNGTLLSSSPECFLKKEGDRLTTRPIKGTRPRSGDPEQDPIEIDSLLNSAKERAELLMIVDLERNDLGRICKSGSVRVADLYTVESYATVHHLVAEVSGELLDGVGLEAILRATFPGGSITGAPKIRAMQLIHELEPDPRGVFSGSIGYIGYDQNLQFNIAIRTLCHEQDRLRLHTGAGIVWDSDPRAEYEETLQKAKAFFTALEFPDSIDLIKPHIVTPQLEPIHNESCSQ